MLLFRSAIADWNHVPSGSMKPTILVGDRIVVDKLAYDLRLPFTLHRLARWNEPARGDVVTFESPQDGRLLVKRVVGLPGDVVEMRNNRLTVNGNPAGYEALTPQEASAYQLPNPRGYQFYRERVDRQSWVVMFRRQKLNDARQSFNAVTVPEGQYLVLGDNRDDSADFRVIGWVERERVLGRAHTVAFSLNYDNYYAPRLNRFFEPLP